MERLINPQILHELASKWERDVKEEREKEAAAQVGLEVRHQHGGPLPEPTRKDAALIMKTTLAKELRDLVDIFAAPPS